MIWPFRRTNQQVSDCLAVLDLLADDFGDQSAWAAVKVDAATVLKNNNDDITQRILRDGIAPRDLVLILLANIALRALGSGQHHTYRGTLSLVGASYRAIFSKIVQMQADAGGITADERDQALINMRTAVAEAG